MVPSQHDIVVVKGKALELEIALENEDNTPIDCTGWDSNMQIGTGPAENGGVVFATARALNATADTGTITHIGDPADGLWRIFIPAPLLEEAVVGDQYWDIDFIPLADTDYKSQYIYGTATVLYRITVL